MRRQAMFFLVLALLLGSLAALLAFQVLRPGDALTEVAGEMATEPVVVADRDIPLGTVLSVEDVRTVQWPAGALPDGFSRSASEVVGRGLLGPVRRNEPILSSKLARPEAGGGLSINIPEGHRALAYRVNDVVGVQGFIRPGHRVDVFVTAGPEAGTGQPTTKLLLQNIEVAATGTTIEPNPQGEPEAVPTVTLHLTPDQAEELTMATENARIQLALRNPLDPDTVVTPGVRLNQLLGVAPAPRPVASGAPAPRPAPAQRSLEVYRGNQRSTSDVTSTVGGGGGGGGGGR
jgi:pilus assembly protein CpaB